VKFLQEVNSCGFVSWIDRPWPTTLDNALLKLWGIYHSSNCARIDDKIEHTMFVEELSTEKKKLEKKYSGLLGDMNKFTNKIEKSGARELPQD
jgi:argonaute-like protein implicated in RNA metabolism and viral defense